MKRDHWLLWRDPQPRSPFENMALDERLLETAPERGRVVVRLVHWDRPTLSFGRAQRYPENPPAGFAAVRRPTGGGVVFHDRDLSYTVVIPPVHAIARLSRLDSYRIFHQAMLDSFGIAAELRTQENDGVDRATMHCFKAPSRFDLMAPDGRKIAGAAQRRTRQGILHQGSIQLPPEAAGTAENALLTALEQAFHIAWEEDCCSPALLESARQLAQERYESNEWNRDKAYAAGH